MTEFKEVKTGDIIHLREELLIVSAFSQLDIFKDNSSLCSFTNLDSELLGFQTTGKKQHSEYTPLYGSIQVVSEYNWNELKLNESYQSRSENMKLSKKLFSFFIKGLEDRLNGRGIQYGMFNEEIDPPKLREEAKRLLRTY